MKILSIKTKLIFDIDVKKNGENAMCCPECNENRRHKGKKSFSWNETKKVGSCKNCDGTFVEYKPFVEKKEFVVPVWKNITQLTEQAVKWFDGRGISQDTIRKMQVYSDIEWMPQLKSPTSVICFPYFIDNKLVNIKFRDGSKNFKLVTGSELIFYNINCLKNADHVVIVEGEMDCLSYIQVGIEKCISVPNGASAKNLEYLDNYIELFNDINKIYIATDNDIKGIELREELIRRFGAERCLVVNYREYKDANEYLMNNGGIALRDTIKDAVEIPVSGIVNLTSYYDEIYKMFMSGIESGVKTGILSLDDLVTWELGRLAVITGIPGHGKSEFVDYVLTRLNVVHGWKVGYFSPENYPIKYHYSKIASKLSGKKFQQGFIEAAEYEELFGYIENNFHFIYPEDDMSFDTIITKARHLVRKNGIKILVIDPYNKIEHLRDRNESETEYISRFLDKLIVFAKQLNVLVVLVAHPRKMDKQTNGLYAKPSLYDINGSANFYNKCDYGISIYRYFDTNISEIDVIKVKFKHLGNGGMAKFKYNYNNGRYETESLTIDNWDNKSYLIKEQEQLQLQPNTQWNEEQEYLNQFNEPPKF